MSLVIHKIVVENFRKFRQPITVEGLTAGLNIVIEANETGKSTLLDALRGAFFVRHNTRNQLAQSFAPHGEAVGPEIHVEFKIDNTTWAVTKRFLKSPLAEVTGPTGRAQGEEAETRLNALLGSVRDTSRLGDVSSYGALGLLWVAQTEALSVSGPGEIVRDTISATLESEVGEIMGGTAYRRVWDRVEAQYEDYWTPTGQKRGRQGEVRTRVEAAEGAARDAADRLAALERSFEDLDDARNRLKVIMRELVDDTDAQTRQALTMSLEVARATAQILATRRAEQEAASTKLKGLLDLQQRHSAATAVLEKAATAHSEATERRAAIAETFQGAKQRASSARSNLELARVHRQNAREALKIGELRLTQAQRSAAISAARARHKELLTLEQQLAEAKALFATAIPAQTIASLEANDRAVAQARAALNAGATRIALSGVAAGVTIDGQPMPVGDRILTHEAWIRIGGTELLVIPPAATSSAEEALALATLKQQASLDELEVGDLASARARNEAARDAAGDMRTFEARIEAATPPDDRIELKAGPEALKLFVTGLEQGEGGAANGIPDVDALKAATEAADSALAHAEGAQDSAIEALRRVEEDGEPLAIAEAGAASDLANAIVSIKAIEALAEWEDLSGELIVSRERAAEAAVALDAAIRNATAHDVAAITRKIDIIDARARTTIEARAKAETEIARLEGTIESEGGLGLADRSAAAQDEVHAARAAYQRVTDEACALKLLRETLEAARNETVAKFVGPVARRAKGHIERLLPSCELTFSEDLTLESVVRAGVNEDCISLSRGTQEQLAILTRIAFADMLLEQGKPVSLILDDPLVYSDDARLDTMIEILIEVAGRMQVILLTCRDRAFRHVPGHRINLSGSI